MMPVPATPLAGIVTDTPATPSSSVRWQPVADSDNLVVRLRVRGSAEGSLDIECVTTDDGTFRLPDATLARLPEMLDRVDSQDIERTRYGIATIGEAIVFTSGFSRRIHVPAK